MKRWLRDERGDADLGMLMLACVVALVFLLAFALVFNVFVFGAGD